MDHQLCSLTTQYIFPPAVFTDQSPASHTDPGPDSGASATHQVGRGPGSTVLTHCSGTALPAAATAPRVQQERRSGAGRRSGTPRERHIRDTRDDQPTRPGADCLMARQEVARAWGYS